MEKMRHQLDENWLPGRQFDVPNDNYFTPTAAEKVADTMQVERREYDYHPSGIEQDETSYKVIEYIPGEECYDEDPIVFMQGFMATASDYDTTLATMAERTGRRVVAWNEIVGLDVGEGEQFEVEAGQPIGPTPESIRYDHESEIPDTQLQKVLGMKELLNRLDIRKATAVAHSEGCIHALALELLSSDTADKSITETEDGEIKREEGGSSLFKKMILLNPAGVLDKGVAGMVIDGVREGALRKRFLGAFGTPEDYLPTGYRDFGEGGLAKKMEIGKHAAKSILNMSRTDAVDMLVELDYKYYREHEDEPMISFVLGDEDRLFPAEKVNRKLGYSPALFNTEEIIDMDDTDHAGAMLDPQRMIKYVMPLLQKEAAEKNRTDMQSMAEEVDEIDRKMSGAA
jgi:pimeloyl-ACP methyl ester carboxylesterase